MTSKQLCTCRVVCERRGRAFPADWSWRCQQLPYLQDWRSADETTREPPYRVRSFWSPDKRYLVTACCSVNDMTLLDDDANIWEPTGSEEDVADPNYVDRSYGPCECGHSYTQHTKGPVPDRYCRHCPCPQWKPQQVKTSAPQTPEPPLPFQVRVCHWAVECFGAPDTIDPEMRTFRFLEEAIELAQACGCTPQSAERILNYVFSRPDGTPRQEAGGVLVSLAVLCNAFGFDMLTCGEDELTRVLGLVEHIRSRHAAKPDFSKGSA